MTGSLNIYNIQQGTKPQVADTALGDVVLPRVQTIDDVLRGLGHMVQYGRRHGHRVGYFAALYYAVTARMKEQLMAGRFEHPALMGQVAVAFSRYYFRAWERWNMGLPVSSSWQVAFDCNAGRRVTVLQDLLLGINAHINLDLGIAIAEVMDGRPLAAIERDYTVMRSIVSSVADNLHTSMMKVNPALPLLGVLLPTRNAMVVTFSLHKARAGAWAGPGKRISSPSSSSPAPIRRSSSSPPPAWFTG